MRTRTMIKNQKVCMVLLTMLLCVWPMLQIHSFVKEILEIEVKGDWNEDGVKTRSLSSIPISAYTDGTYLYIQNISPNCDITVTITNEATGDAVYEHTFPQEATSYMVISIADLPAGVYMLELSNLDGGYLIGNFSK